MHWLQNHLRNKLIAGALAAAPIVIVGYAALWLEERTQPVTEHLGFHFPGLGVVILIVAVYLLGLAVTSLLGKLFLGLVDRALQGIPGLRLLYQSFKDVLVPPVEKEGTFHQVVLVPLAGGAQLGFTSGQPLPEAPHTLSVFLPNLPNPLSGRLVLIERAHCLALDLSAQEAFKFLLSTGNYVPAGLRTAAAETVPANG